MTLQQSERFATKENVLKVMCALIRNGNVEQTVMIVDFGFLDIVKVNVDLIQANPAEILQVLFRLGDIAISYHFKEWIERIAVDEIL
jgi:hypothetical protein